MTDTFAQRWEELRDLPNHPEMSVFPDRTPRITHGKATDPNLAVRCPNCKQDLRDVSSMHCPRCGAHLEHEPVTVFAAAEQSLVWAAAMAMDRHEISNLIVTGSFDPIIGVFTKVASMPHVMVPLKFVHEAADILERQFGRRLFKHGERPEPPPEGTPWTCPSCGEESPASFDICWNCNSQRPDA